MNRLLMVLMIAAVLVVVLLAWVMVRQRAQVPSVPSTPVWDEPQQKEIVSPQAPKWHQRRKER